MALSDLDVMTKLIAEEDKQRQWENAFAPSISPLVLMEKAGWGVNTLEGLLRGILKKTLWELFLQGIDQCWGVHIKVVPC
jgi:hypothetical protein